MVKQQVKGILAVLERLLTLTGTFLCHMRGKGLGLLSRDGLLLVTYSWLALTCFLSITEDCILDYEFI